MVTFVTFFLWLMTDVHTVEVTVDPAVSSVEILLDGRHVGYATAPRWRVKCDFGERLQPHVLAAVARDEEGVELGRAKQFVNLPRDDAVVEMVFEGGTPEAPEMVRVVTENVERFEPMAVFVTFNGRSLLPEEDGRFRLPPYDPGEMHLVGAEAHFPEGITARSDVTFGGAYGSQLTTELTAVPIEIAGKRPPTVSDLEGSLRVGDHALRIAAVDRQGAQVFIVRDVGAWPLMRKIGFLLDRNPTMRFRRMVYDPDLPLKRDRMHLVGTAPTIRRDLALFPFSEAYEIKPWSLSWIVSHARNQPEAAAHQELSDAVAVAGLRAAGSGTPRAVILVVAPDAVNHSRHQPQVVREYLSTLRVPLVVWSADEEGVVTGWGPSEDISSTAKLQKASKRLVKDLQRQWIVWVEGRHLPYEIELDESVEGFRLAR
jgi:hypothetical protein